MTGYKLFMGDLQLPISPKKVTVKIAGQNKEITLADGTNTNILNSPKLAEVSFRAILPSVQYAFAESLVPITDFTTRFNEWMTGKKSVVSKEGLRDLEILVEAVKAVERQEQPRKADGTADE